MPECTFIILDKQLWTDPGVEEEQCMVGDVNIFLTDPSDPTLAELEIMIAGEVLMSWNVLNLPVLHVNNSPACFI